MILLITSCVCSLDISVAASTSYYPTVELKARTFVVGLDVAQVVSTGIVRLPNTHRVVGEVDIAVIAFARC